MIDHECHDASASRHKGSALLHMLWFFLHKWTHLGVAKYYSWFVTDCVSYS